MKVIIGSKIKIVGAEERVKRLMRKALTLVNPQYQMAVCMARKDPAKRKMLYAMTPTFKYYTEVLDTFIVSRGLKERILRFFKVNKFEYELEENYCSKLMKNYLAEKIVLRDYQEGDDDTILQHKQGIIKLGTAYGKTIIALKLAEENRLRTLIICCKAELSELSKYKHDFKEIYGYDIGVIQGKVCNISDVTVATMSTLARSDLSKLKNEFGMLIVDECHVSLSDKRKKVVESFNSYYRYGMSGTPGRANGQSEAVKFLYGSIIIDKKLPQDKPSVHVYKTNVDVGASQYHEMEEAVMYSVKRNVIIRNIIKERLSENRRILVLTKRIEHGVIIREELKHFYKINSIAISSKDPASMRNELIQALRSEQKDFQVLIGTYSLLSTGVDIERLDTVILAMSIKVDGEYDATLIQSVGRILRLYGKKQKPLIIDLDDNLNKIMHRHHNSRMAVYKREGWCVSKMN